MKVRSTEKEKVMKPMGQIYEIDQVLLDLVVGSWWYVD